jgi:hypothetical protein
MTSMISKRGPASLFLFYRILCAHHLWLRSRVRPSPSLSLSLCVSPCLSVSPCVPPCLSLALSLTRSLSLALSLPLCLALPLCLPRSLALALCLSLSVCVSLSRGRTGIADYQMPSGCGSPACLNKSHPVPDQDIVGGVSQCNTNFTLLHNNR